MAQTMRARLAHAWNVFVGTDEKTWSYGDSGVGSSRPPDRNRMRTSNERSIVSSIYTRLGIDVASVAIKHVRLDENERYLETIPSGLNDCLTVEANLDQAARHFRLDIAMTLFDKGVLAIVPVDTTLDPAGAGGFDIRSVRVGWISQWFPSHVQVNLYNEKTGLREDLMLPKKTVAIIENPLYQVMNEPNSTLQRLIRKLNLLDVVDEQSSSGKLDLILQLPYVIKSQSRRDEAEARRKAIEVQLQGSQHGIAYTDGTEKITQLNRPVENNLLAQVEYLTNLLYSQLGLTPAIFDGTADETAMINYYNRTIEPIVSAITEGMKRTFLTKTARTQGQSIEFFKEPFKLVPVSDIAEIADKLTRNEILTSNEFRAILGFKPAEDERADQLINKNIPDPNAVASPAASGDAGGGADAVLSDLETKIDELLGSGGGDGQAPS